MYLDFKGKLDQIVWEGSYTPNCTVSGVPFQAKISLVYEPGDKIIEFIEFEKAMNERFDKQTMIIEDIPEIVGEEVLKDLGAKGIAITVEASTKVHNNVEVSWSKYKV